MTQFGLITMEKVKKTPRWPLVSADTNPRSLAARVSMTRSSPCRLRPPRAHCSPTYLTQDQRGELIRSRISAVAAAKAAKPADDSGDDNDDNDKKELQSISKKGNDGGDDKQGVKEGGV